MEENKLDKKGKRLLPYINKHKLLLLITILCLLAEIAVDILFANAQKNLADVAIKGSFSLLKQYLVIISFIIISDLFIKILRTYGAGRFSEYCLYDIRLKTFNDISKLPIPYLDKHPSGDLVSRVTSDLGLLQGFLQNTLGDIVATPIRVFSAALFLFILNWKLTTFCMISIPLLFFLTMKTSAPIEKLTKEQQEELGKVNALAQDSISGLIVTKSFGLESTMDKKYNDAVDKAVAKGLKVTFFSSLTSPLGTLMNILPFIFTFGYGGYLAIKGELTFGALIAFIQLMNYVVNPLNNIPNIMNSLRSSSAGIQRLSEIWDEPKERNTGEETKVDNGIALSFNDVHFGYDNEKMIAKGISFDIKEGEKVALVGHSGCGKSTLLKLITGFYNADKGNIKIYGRSTDSWKLHNLRALISMVSQDNYLFPESIYTNILYGDSKADKEDITEAAKTANIEEFIESLPERYETLTGERGVRLSGGQKQRIAIARAVLKNSPILLLDEATSALDTESEKEVQKALEKLMNNRTTLVIAHRLSTIKNVDRIIVLNDGQVVETGTHDELIKGDTLYSQLYSKQFIEA